jgi:hypothetical protein
VTNKKNIRDALTRDIGISVIYRYRRTDKREKNRTVFFLKLKSRRKKGSPAAIPTCNPEAANR